MLSKPVHGASLVLRDTVWCVSQQQSPCSIGLEKWVSDCASGYKCGVCFTESVCWVAFCERLLEWV